MFAVYAAKTVRVAQQIIKETPCRVCYRFWRFRYLPRRFMANCAVCRFDSRAKCRGLSNLPTVALGETGVIRFPKAFSHEGGLVGRPCPRGYCQPLPEPAERFQGREGRLKILVVGGSLGADVLNKTVPESFRHYCRGCPSANVSSVRPQ